MNAQATVRGRVHRFGDDVNTDLIIAAQHKAASLSIADMAAHTFEDIAPDFSRRVVPGDIVVAGANFGCGSSRETAVHVLQHLGLAAVLAESFARIFFRNAINLGLLVAECDTNRLNQDDILDIDVETGSVLDVTNGTRLTMTPLPAVMRALLDAGGMVQFLRKYGDLVLPPPPAPSDNHGAIK